MPRKYSICCGALCGVALLFTATVHDCAIAQSTPPESDETVTSERHTFLNRATLVLGLGLGAGALAREEFDNTDEMARIIDGSPFAGALDVADIYGSGVAMGATSLGLLALGRATGDPELYAVGKDLTSSMLLTWSAVWALKLTINAKRPNGGDYSFPSGHTATAFAAAPVLAKHFGPKVGYVSYGMAILTGMARMEDQKHYLGDVLAGAAIGLVASREVTARSDGRWTIAPAFPRMGVSVQF